MLINVDFRVGQEEELSYIVYGTKGVLKLRNWSELTMMQKNSPFGMLTFLIWQRQFWKGIFHQQKIKEHF